MAQLQPNSSQPDWLEYKREWDFSKVSASQIRWCYYYEYLRESDAVRELFDRYPQRRSTEISADDMELLEEFRNLVVFPASEVADGVQPIHLLAGIARISDFPKKPWQALSGDLRLEVIHGYHDLVRFNPELFPEDLEAFAKRRREGVDATPETVGIIRLPVGLSVEEILEAIGRALKKFAKEHPQSFRIPLGRRGSYGDRLKQLGALRVLKKTSPDEAASYSKPNGYGGVALYRDRAEFLIARAKAKKVLRSMIRGQ